MGRLIAVVLGACLAVGIGGAAKAQEVTGSIAGSVLDKSGAGVAKASVTLTNTDQNIVVRKTQTSDRGEYIATFLPIGHYAVMVEAQGFRKVTQTGIILNVNDRLTVNFTMEVGSII